jgi:hypothetical protein
VLLPLRQVLYRMEERSSRFGMYANANFRKKHSTYGRFFTSPETLSALAVSLVCMT